MGRSKNNPCDKCAFLIYSMREEKMICKHNKTHEQDCFISEYENYIQESESIAVNKWVTLYVNEHKKKALIKEVRYKEKDVDTSHITDEEKKKRYIKTHNKSDIRYNIEIDNETILYSFVCNMQNKCFLQGKKDNDIYDGERIQIEITNYDYLLDLLWEIAEYSDYGMLPCVAPSRAR